MKTLKLSEKQSRRLHALAVEWRTTPDDALRRVLDQALVGRGAMKIAEVGLTFLEHLMTKSLAKPLAKSKEGVLP